MAQKKGTNAGEKVSFHLNPKDFKKNREWPMSQSGKCKDNLNFHAHYRIGEKNEVKV